MINQFNKNKILQSCIQKQEELVESFKSRETEMHDDSNSHNATDSQSENRKAGKIDVLNALRQELIFAQKELHYLNSLNVENKCGEVEPGAVVVTETITFFIGVSSEKVEVDGQNFFGISTNAPIYASMKGLKKGDKFQFNETEYLVKDVY